MSSRYRKKKSHVSSEMALQITSMADIFTIILVFLLKSFAMSPVNISPPAGMMIPEAEAGALSKEALKLEITQNGVQVESKPVAALQNFRFAPGEVLANLSSQSVNTALEKERKRQELISQANADVKADSKILIIADKKVPYVTVKSVLASA
ncbi:MAG: biopolymer transporter ExbD, partial [Bdellovibrionia bacterium]